MEAMTMTNTETLRLEDAAEYDAAALYCAKRGRTGAIGTELPANMTTRCVDAINADPDAFAERVRASAYMLACERQ